MVEINKIYNEDCLEGMKRIADNLVDLVVTSPPYDHLRKYNGIGDDWTFEKFKRIANELKRVIRKGGTIIWVVGDSTKNGSESGTSFKQALYFKEIGLNIHDTMIYAKNNYVPLTHNRYEQQFEYMFVLTNGKPNVFNPIRIPCKNAGKVENYGGNRRGMLDSNQAMRCPQESCKMKTKNTKIHPNIFYYSCGLEHTGHPAVFPLQLATEQVCSWSNANDIILDPFMGSGTTAIACMNTQRNFIGFEMDKGYYDIACKRIADHD